MAIGHIIGLQARIMISIQLKTPPQELPRRASDRIRQQLGKGIRSSRRTRLYRSAIGLSRSGRNVPSVSIYTIRPPVYPVASSGS